LLKEGKGEREKYILRKHGEKNARPTVSEWNVQGDSCTACASGRFTHQKANAATRETLIQPFYHDRNFPTIGIRGQITCHLPLRDHPRARG